MVMAACTAVTMLPKQASSCDFPFLLLDSSLARLRPAIILTAMISPEYKTFPPPHLGLDGWKLHRP